METPQVNPARLLELYEAVCQLNALLEPSTVGFESEPGQGSTFWFTLPIAVQPDSAST